MHSSAALVLGSALYGLALAASAAPQLNYSVATSVNTRIDSDSDGRNGTSFVPLVVGAGASAHSASDKNYGAVDAAGSAYSIVDFGHVGVSASASASVDAPPLTGWPYAVGKTYGMASASADASFYDEMYVTSSGLLQGTKVTLSFKVPTDGQIFTGGNGAATSKYTLRSELYVNGKTAQWTNFAFDPLGKYEGFYTLDYEAYVGQRVQVAMGLHVFAQVTAPNYTDGKGDVQGSQAVLGLNFENTSRLYVSSGMAGVSLLADSGHNYAAPVPEPGQYTLLLAGLLGLAVVRRGKR